MELPNTAGLASDKTIPPKTRPATNITRHERFWFEVEGVIAPTKMPLMPAVCRENTKSNDAANPMRAPPPNESNQVEFTCIS
jgi:hypothetical protein